MVLALLLILPFSWWMGGGLSLQEDIFVTRAPGRLDVMGGIADYSGSLVLQVPSIFDTVVL